MEEPIYMLTTIDNPWDPFEQFDEWYAFDMSHGYRSCGYLANVAKDSPDISAAQSQREVNNAIDEIIAMHPGGPYTKVLKKKSG